MWFQNFGPHCIYRTHISSKIHTHSNSPLVPEQFVLQCESTPLQKHQSLQCSFQFLICPKSTQGGLKWSSFTKRERERMCLPIYACVSDIQSIMAFRRGGLILMWTGDVAFFSASPCGLPQNLGRGQWGVGRGPRFSSQNTLHQTVVGQLVYQR